MVGVGFYLLTRISSYLSLVYGLEPLLASALPGLAMLALAFWLTRRVH
jgi:lipopolysaccharide export LptBFGC system permease protein LptF